MNGKPITAHQMPPRLTEEEVNEFNPTMDNPLVVTCDTGAYDSQLKRIQVISRVVDGRVAILNANGFLAILHTLHLKEYPSQKKPTTKMVQFYQVVYKEPIGDVRLSTLIVNKNCKDTSGDMIFDDAVDVIKLIPVCELEMPIDFEE